MSGQWNFKLLGGPTADASQWGVITDLSSARSRRLSYRLKDADVLTYTADGLADDTAPTQELLTDVVAERDGVNMFRGRVTSTGDTIDGLKHDVSVTATAYRGLLGRRMLMEGDPILTAYSSTLSYPAVEQEEIGWQLISTSQARTNGFVGITRGGSQATGRVRNRTYDPGISIKDAIDQLANVDDGFEWEIDKDLVYRVYYPQRGDSATPWVLELGGATAKVNRTVVSTAYANVVRVAGGTSANVSGDEVPTVPVTSTSAAVSNSTDVSGRWETSIGSTDLTLQNSIAERSVYELNQAETITPSYTVVLNPEIWGGPQDFWLGDVAQLIVVSGRLNVNTTVRCVAVDVDISDAGVETVTATLGALTPAQAYLNGDAEINRRLETLERR